MSSSISGAMIPQSKGQELNIIGSNISRLRSEAEWTQEDLAAKCNLLGWDISRATLSKIEYGIRRVNDAEVYLFTQVFHCSFEDLYLGLETKTAIPKARHGRSH